ncbi:MAG: hypothetical protein E6J65_05630 [Deltaproteobacteria bacterium]|nr:MAG: hypothetical protein E6J65_05630 [Deltaproteobacteria bacterium]
MAFVEPIILSSRKTNKVGFGVAYTGKRADSTLDPSDLGAWLLSETRMSIAPQVIRRTNEPPRESAGHNGERTVLQVDPTSGAAPDFGFVTF